MEIQLTSILLQILNFGIVAGALTYLLFKPIRKILDERARMIAEGHDAAQKAMAERSSAEELKAKAKKEAQLEAKQLLDEARTEVSAKKAEMLKDAKAEVAEFKEKARKDAEAEKASQMVAQQSEFEAAVIAVAEKLMGASIDAKQHTDLIKRGLKEIASA